MKPITFQIQIETLNYTEQDVKSMLTILYRFTDELMKYGHTHSQMYIGDTTYNGEPL